MMRLFLLLATLNKLHAVPMRMQPENDEILDRLVALERDVKELKAGSSISSSSDLPDVDPNSPDITNNTTDLAAGLGARDHGYEYCSGTGCNMYYQRGSFTGTGSSCRYFVCYRKWYDYGKKKYLYNKNVWWNTKGSRNSKYTYCHQKPNTCSCGSLQ